MSLEAHRHAPAQEDFSVGDQLHVYLCSCRKAGIREPKSKGPILWDDAEQLAVFNDPVRVARVMALMKRAWVIR